MAAYMGLGVMLPGMPQCFSPCPHAHILQEDAESLLWPPERMSLEPGVVSWVLVNLPRMN